MDAGALLQDAIGRLWQRGAVAWPELPLERDTFARHLLGHFSQAVAAEELDRLEGEDLYLACACLFRLPGAVDAFDARYRAELRRHLARIDARAETADELRQALLVKLFVPGAEGAAPKIAEYSGRGPLLAWLRMAAARMALNLKRDQARMTGLGDELVEGAARAPLDVELAFIRGRYESDFRAALRQAVDGAPRDEKHILALHYREGLTVDQLAAALRTGRTSAFRKLAAARESLWERLRAILQARLGATGQDVESLLRVVRSGLALTLAEELRVGLQAAPRKR